MSKNQNNVTDSSTNTKGNILSRMLPPVVMHPADRMLEIFSAILLSLATVSSAWCAYQAARWNGVQSIYFSEAASAGRDAVHKSLLGQQRIMIDTSLFLEFAAAKTQNNEVLADFLHARFPPVLKKSVDAWMATKPLKNPEALPSPFDMPEYTYRRIAGGKTNAYTYGEKTISGPLCKSGIGQLCAAYRIVCHGVILWRYCK